MTSTFHQSGNGADRVAVVTGASSGIGAATVRRLASEGWDVIAVARRGDSLRELAESAKQVGECVRPLVLDITTDAVEQKLTDALERCDLVVNVAGGAFGDEWVEQARIDDWRWTFEVNVVGALQVTQALIPLLRESRDGTVVLVTSTASLTAYEGGGAYCAAKHAQHVLGRTLRLELCGDPIRVVEVAPGMVHTAEFSLNRYRGDGTKVENAYRGMTPLNARDVADAIAWAVAQPSHVNVDLIVLRPLDQAAQHKINRQA